jgi:hypothetical protein
MTLCSERAAAKNKMLQLERPFSLKLTFLHASGNRFQRPPTRQAIWSILSERRSPWGYGRTRFGAHKHAPAARTQRRVSPREGTHAWTFAGPAGPRGRPFCALFVPPLLPRVHSCLFEQRACDSARGPVPPEDRRVALLRLPAEHGVAHQARRTLCPGMWSSPSTCTPPPHPRGPTVSGL